MALLPPMAPRPCRVKITPASTRIRPPPTSSTCFKEASSLGSITLCAYIRHLLYECGAGKDLTAGAEGAAGSAYPWAGRGAGSCRLGMVSAGALSTTPANRLDDLSPTPATPIEAVDGVGDRVGVLSVA